MLNNIFSAANKYGGILPSIKFALFYYKRHGLRAVYHRLRVVLIHAPKKPMTIRDTNYENWYAKYGEITDELRNKILSEITITPVISILMPVYNTNIEMLKHAIDSVIKQSYQNWELCVADDASTDVNIRNLLEDYSKKDSRIKVKFRSTNGHISEASNSALEIAKGEYVALFDHDDELTQDALLLVVQAININPNAKLIYSDEDKINEKGRLFWPYFKCDWNYDLFFSHNMITHLGVYKTEIVRNISGFRKGFEGAQDYDLALRFIEKINSQEIVHIPRILYHWRVHSKSTANDTNAKPYAMLAGERALNEYFQRNNIAAVAELQEGNGYFRVRYDLPKELPLVSIIIPTHNGLRLLSQCVSSILDLTNYKNYEIIIIDNNSDDPDTLDYLDKIQRNENIRIIRDERPFNYSALNNNAVKLASGDVIALLNNDIEVITPDWLDEMVSISLQPGVGAVGARLWYPHKILQHAGIILGIGGIAGHAHKGYPEGNGGYMSRAILQQSFSAVTAACLVVKKSIYQEVNGLDEVNLKVAFNDVDFCLRMREAGYRNVWTPYAELYHHESATRGYEDTPEKIERFEKESAYMKKRWGKLLENDPAYSPNLTLEREDFTFAYPPRVIR